MTRSLGRLDYAERREARIERLGARAEKVRAEGQARIAGADRIASVIPMGQPILVGHHSEGRHRRDLKRIQDGYGKGYGLLRQADQFESRASAAESNTAISRDDPDALDKLRVKLTRLQAHRETMKTCNAAIRKNAKRGPDTQIAALVALGIAEPRARDLLQPDFCNRIGFADYEITNSGAEVRRLEKRIVGLEALEKRSEREPEKFGEATIVESQNRVAVSFQGKPPEPIRSELKRAGFRWAPSTGAWQRHASDTAWHEARRIARAFSAGF